jgi:hypothetical protein
MVSDDGVLGDCHHDMAVSGEERCSGGRVRFEPEATFTAYFEKNCNISIGSMTNN